MIVPDAYGNKSVKWLQRILLTNNFQANDTYAGWNNDTESAIKTCARFVHVPEEVQAGKPIAITGLAQFDAATGTPREWPLRNTIVHWAALLQDIAPGQYQLACRTIDAQDIPQPMPRPFPKSGHNAIQHAQLSVKA